MNKNQWSLRTYSEKDISKTIMAIEEQPHTEEDFTRLLVLKQSFEKDKLIPQPEELIKVLNCKSKKRQQQTSNLCSCCFEFMGSNKYWCKICGNSTCRKCLVRERQLRDQSKAFFCQKCDQQYLRAMSGIQLYNKAQKLERTLQRLIQEQQGIQKLVSAQREKLITTGTNYYDIATKGAEAQRLIEENKILKVRCSELAKKVEFGRSLSKDLKRKLHTLRKEQRQSFGTLSNNEEERESLSQHVDELNLSIDHNKESIITVTDRNSVSMMDDIDAPRKCKCDIY